MCNLMAFVVFTAWPCMPPRLLPEEDGFSFVDTVHAGKVASVWTTNKFCNQLGRFFFHFFFSFDLHKEPSLRLRRYVPLFENSSQLELPF